METGSKSEKVQREWLERFFNLTPEIGDLYKHYRLLSTLNNDTEELLMERLKLLRTFKAKGVEIILLSLLYDSVFKYFSDVVSPFYLAESLMKAECLRWTEHHHYDVFKTACDKYDLHPENVRSEVLRSLTTCLWRVAK